MKYDMVAQYWSPRKKEEKQGREADQRVNASEVAAFLQVERMSTEFRQSQ